jgi:hypothetical protein
MGALAETQVVANELERVNPKVPLLFEREDTFFSKIEKKNVEIISARDMRIPLELRPGGNPGHFDPAGGTLGKGSGPTFDKAVVGSVYLKYGVEYHKKAEWATDSARKSVVNTVKHLLATGMAEFRRFADCLCMTGGDGVLGTISAISTSGGKDTYTLDTDGFGARLLRFAQYVGVFNAALSVQRAVVLASGGDSDNANTVNIDLVDIGAKQVRIAGAMTGVIVGDKLVANGLGTAPVSLFGIQYHHSDASSGTWLGFDRSLFPEIRSNRVNAAGSLALSHARLALNKIGDRLGKDHGMKVAAWTHPCQAAAYEDLGQTTSIIQKVAKGQDLNLYFGGQFGSDMQLAGADLITHFAWNKKRIDFVDPELWGRAETHEPSFYEEGGRRLFEVRDSNGYVKAATVFYITAAMQLFHLNPAGASYIDGLTIPDGY